MHSDALSFPQLLAATSAAAGEFLQTLPGRPAASLAAPSKDLLSLPEEGNGALAALARFRRRFEAGLSGSAGPRYLGFVTGGTTPAALVGDWLTTAYDQNPANEGDSLASAVEHETLSFLRELFDLPDTFQGAFVSGATAANTVALATARQWAAARLGVDVAESGSFGLPRIPVLGGAPHASIDKALSILGMGRRSIERIATLPGRTAVDPEALAARLAALGEQPAIVVASAGEVNTGDFDDLAAVAELCRRHGAWLHVDGAFGLFAAADPERAPLLAGIEQADSITTDGHKWLNVPYDSGLVFTRHLELQQQVYRATAAYLGEVGPDFLHRVPENSRRFRALPAWMTLQAYGRAGYRELVQRTCELARRLGGWLKSNPRFELLAPVRLNIVCFTLRGADTARRDRFLAALARDGRVFCTPTVYAGKPAVRAAFSNWSTTEADLATIVATLGEVAG